MKIFIYSICSLIFIVYAGAAMAETGNEKSIGEIPELEWSQLLSKKIFFAHQSVGDNIIQGIIDLQKDYPWLKFNIIETQNQKDFSDPFFSHAKVGINENPGSKVEEFKEMLESDLMGHADVAALKLCYIDFNKNTDVLKVFNKYKQAVDSIREKNPEVLIIHFTAPLTTIQTGIKAWVKKIIGKPLDGVKSNIARNQYNELILKEFSGKDVIFDVAKFESTLPDGGRVEFHDAGKTYYSLANIYTYDGGHLNKEGRKYIAEKFLLLLLDTAG